MVDGDECTCQVPKGEESSSISSISTFSSSSFSSFPTVSFSTTKATPDRKDNSVPIGNSFKGNIFVQNLAKSNVIWDGSSGEVEDGK